MKKLILAIIATLAIAASASAQQAASWTSATAVNSSVPITVTGNLTIVSVTFNPVGTLTGGSLVFEASTDGAIWFPFSLTRTNAATSESSFALSGAAAQAWVGNLAGFSRFQVRLNPAVTGTGSAQVSVSAAGAGPSSYFDFRYCQSSGCTMTGSLLLPDGSLANPALAAFSNPDSGIRFSAGLPQVVIDGAAGPFFGGAGRLVMPSGAFLGWSNTSDSTGTVDFFFLHPAAATIQQGQNSATPIAQNKLVANGTGTDIAAALLSPRIRASMPTGTGLIGTGSLSGGALGGTTGTTLATEVDRFIWGVSRSQANNTATTRATAAVASNSVAAVEIVYGVEVFNGTDLQVEDGSVTCHVTNRGGVIANNTCVKFGNQQAMTVGTLAVTWTITAANPALIQVNANSSLTPSAGYPRVTFSIKNLTSQAITAP